MPPWVEFFLKAGPLVVAVVLGILQMYLSGKFAEFREKVDAKLDAMEEKIDRKYPARDIIDLMFKGIEARVKRVERKIDSGVGEDV